MKRCNLLTAFIFVLLVFGCNEEPKVDNPKSNVDKGSNHSFEVNSSTSSSSGHKYNYRSSFDSPYEYNYDVTGFDVDGNEVEGNVDMQGKYGEGYIYDEDDNEIYIDAEWINNGELEATDQDGNTYELEVD